MPEEDSFSLRKDFHEAIQDILEEYEGVLSGWVLIYETMRTDNNKYLTVMSADATGENNLPPWTTEGWAGYVANQGTPDGIFEPELDDEELDDDED